MFEQRFSGTVVKRVPSSRFLFVLVGSLVLSTVFINFFHAEASAAQRRGVQSVKPAISSAVSKTWFFAEGRVGAGFREYLTISNPDPSIDCSAQITYLPEGSVSAHVVKPLLVQTVSIAHASRFTTSVNQDLHIGQQQNPGILLSALVTVPSLSNCAGVVVERPMYFNYRGISSGTDVVGAIQTSTTSYFADVPTSSSIATFLSILNPPTGSTAAVMARYYAGGTQVGSQSITVAAGSRGTLTPGSLSLPAHVAAIISSSQPVVVERSIYRHAVSEGVVGVVSTASSVLGVPTLSNHWLFAEGYTNARSQENLLLSNLTGAPTTATVILEYQNAHHQTLTQLVAAYSQVTLNINQLNAHPTGVCDSTPCSPTAEVSADISSTTLSLVAERQMFFRYSHTLPFTQLNVTATGGTDVVGATAAATATANFAEGYTNAGYNEWLTLQNPTLNAETLAVTLRNEYGHSYTQNVHVNSKSRSTVDITAWVRQHLVQAGNDSRAYQVSMSVQAAGSNVQGTHTQGVSFVAERPMYFQLSSQGIQGGSDVVSFTGAAHIMATCTELSTSLNDGDGIDFMTAGPDGNVWFTEKDSGNKVGYITPTGATTEYTIPTASSDPEGITAGPDGNVWFTEFSGNKIGRVTPAGVITEYTIPTYGSGPYGIIQGADNNLWFSQYNTDQIGRITPSGVITEFTVPTVGAGSYGNTLGPDGNVWFPESNYDKIGRITTAGVVTEFAVPTAGSQVYNITTGSDGNLWFTAHTGNNIGRITTAGVVTEFPASGNPYGIAAAPDGNLWFTEEGSTKVASMTTAGVVTEIDLGVNTHPAAMTLGPDNNLWFSDYNTGKIGRCTFSA